MSVPWRPDSKWEECEIEYQGEHETDLTVEGGKLVTIIDSEYTKGDISFGDTTIYINGNQGMNTIDMEPGNYKIELGRETTISAEPTEYYKVRIKLSELSSKFNEKGEYNHGTWGYVSFPAEEPEGVELKSLLIFCSGSVLSVLVPDSEGCVEVYVEKTKRQLITNTSFDWKYSNESGFTVGTGGGINAKDTVYDKASFALKGKQIEGEGTVLTYVPAGNYTIKMTNVPSDYEAVEPVPVTVTNSSSVQSLKITLNASENHTGIEHHPAVDATCHQTGMKEYWTCSESACAGKYYANAECTVETTLASLVIPMDKTNHTGGTELKGGVAATCENAGCKDSTYCLGCGVRIAEGESIPALGHNHTIVQCNAEGHWYKCTRCVSTTDVMPHTGEYTCDVCGYIIKEEPTTEEPTTEEPTTEEPTTEEPTTEEPTTQEPTTEEPTTEEPTTEEPTTEEPTTQEPTTEEPTTEEPTTEEPTTEEPTTQEPTTEEPTTQEPTTEEEVVEIESEDTPLAGNDESKEETAPVLGDSTGFVKVIMLVLATGAAVLIGAKVYKRNIR